MTNTIAVMKGYIRVCLIIAHILNATVWTFAQTTPQFGLPGDFTPPFQYLNSVPNPGVDLDDDGVLDVVPSCSCAGVTSIIQNGENADDGFFYDQLIVASGVSGQNWSLNSFSNMLSRPPEEGLNGIFTFREIGQTGVYVLPFMHSEQEPYVATVYESSDPGTLYGPVLNQCFYPDPEILNLGDFYCDNEPDFDLEALVTSPYLGEGVPLIPLSDEWLFIRQEDGEEIISPVFSPSTLGQGTYTVQYTADFGPYAAPHTGCSRTVETALIIRSTTMACNSGLNVSINPNTCVATITPTLLLAGTPISDREYSVHVLASDGTDLGEQIPAEYAGEVVTGVLSDGCNGNFCTVPISVFDYHAPELIIPSDTILSCIAEVDTAVTGVAIAMDCDEWTLSFIDDYFETDCGVPKVELFRIWTATDASGNSTEMTQTIGIARGTQADLRFPVDVEIECSAWNENPFLAEASPEGAGIPNLVDIEHCGLLYTYSDDTIGLCGDVSSNFTILREWLVIDNCSNQIFSTDGVGNDNIQFIQVRDNTPPQMNVEDIEVSADISAIESGVGTCTSIGFIPPPALMDDCNDVSVRIFTPIGEAEYVNGVDGTQGANIPAPGLQMGDYLISYELEDACGNTSMYETHLTVVDVLPPIMICNGSIQLTLASGGTGILRAEDLDGGSRDNCCLESVLIKKMDEPDTAYREEIHLFCENDILDVVVRATDCSGNFNECIVEVVVLDPIPPQVVFAPADTLISCLDDYQLYYDSSFQEAQFIDNCDFTVEFEVEEYSSSCGLVRLDRVWTARDHGSNLPAVVTQIINFDRIHDYSLNIPADAEGGCMDFNLDSLELEERGCELFTVNTMEDTIYIDGGDYCYKIQRDYSIINWCEFSDASPLIELPRVQLNFLDTLADAYELYTDGDILYRNIPGGTVEIGESSGRYHYEQYFFVNDSAPPSFTAAPIPTGCITTNDCGSQLAYQFTVKDDCSFDNEVTYQFQNNGSLPELDSYGSLSQVNDTSFIISGSYPPGINNFVISLTDHCGNIRVYDRQFEVLDCVPPTIACVDTFVVELGDDGIEAIQLDQVVIAALDNCDDPLTSFSQFDHTVEMIFDCNAQGDSTVYVWATDDAGNQRNCPLVFQIRDSLEFCPKYYSLSGNVRRANGDGIPNATVYLYADSTFTSITDENGAYQFDHIVEGFNYRLVVTKNNNFGNGVSTFDLVKIHKHIIAVQDLDGPLEQIAADANASGIISTLDIIKLRKLVLGITNDIPENTSWRFIPDGFVFTNPDNPFEDNFPEQVSFDLDQEALQFDFTAIKIGDINQSANLQE